MKFFKHFTDSHEGRSMMTLFDEMGHAGPNCYWILVEICAGKLDKSRSEIITEMDCKFNLHERLVRDKFRLSSTKVQHWFNLGSTLNLFSVEQVGNEFQIYMPKLLDSLDRNSKIGHKLVTSRSQSGHPDKDKDIPKGIDKDKECSLAQPIGNSVNKKPLTEQTNVVANFDARFTNPEFSKFKPGLKKLGKFVEISWARRTHVLLEHFGDYDKFSSWVNVVWNSPGYESCPDEESKQRYLSGAIARQVGIS